uniref:Uncharacterized protein n=1 Tax=Arundo donax TaxID=35708 RepID=A0A0A9NLM0_ARUDO
MSSTQDQSVPLVGEKESSHGTAGAEQTTSKPVEVIAAKQQSTAGSLLGLAYESSDEE